MIARSVTIAALSAALAVTAALAADPPASPEKERLICRRAAKTIGSHIRTPRRCRTAAQWQAEQEEAPPVPISLQVTQGQGDGRPVVQPR